MNVRTLTVLVIIVAACGLVRGDSSSDTTGKEASSNATVEIYLPRKISVECESLTLRDISLVSTESEKLTRAVESLAMGRAPWTEERIVIDRATILSRLASNGLKASRVTFSGADEVAVSRKETSVSSTRIVKAAEAFLESNLESKKGTTWRVAREPKNVTLPEKLDVELQAELDPNSPHGYLRVNVKVLDDRKELDAVSVLFEVAYPVQKVVATQDIEAGEKITSDNIKIVTETSATPSDEDFVPPYGLVAKHSIRKDAEISRSILQVPERPMLIQRNQVVEMRLEGDGFAVRAVGQALERGRAGDLIKVRNIDTKRVIVAKIMSGGYVRPVVKK